MSQPPQPPTGPGNEPTQQLPSWPGNEPTQQLPAQEAAPSWGTSQPSAPQAYPNQPIQGQQYPSQGQQYPGQQGQPYGGQQYPGQQYGAQQYGGQQYPGQQYGTQQYAGQGVPPGGPGAPGGPGQPGGSGSNRTPLLIALVAVLVVALGIGGYFLFRPDKDTADQRTTVAPTSQVPTTAPTTEASEPETTEPTEPETTEPTEPETTEASPTESEEPGGTGSELPVPTDPIPAVVGQKPPAKIGNFMLTKVDATKINESEALAYIDLDSQQALVVLASAKDADQSKWKSTALAMTNPVKVPGGYCGNIDASTGNDAGGCMLRTKDDGLVVIMIPNGSPEDAQQATKDFVAAMK